MWGKILRRLRNHGTMLAIGSRVIQLLLVTEMITSAQAEVWQIVLIGVLEILTNAGVINNPDSGKGFKDITLP